MEYKGLEIMQMISKGQIEDGTRFDFENNNFNGEVEYYNGTLYWIRFDENWKETGKKNLFEMVADFEPLKDEIEIDNIKEYKQEHTERCIDVDIRNKINELIQAIKQINKEVKEVKEDKENVR